MVSPQPSSNPFSGVWKKLTSLPAVTFDVVTTWGVRKINLFLHPEYQKIVEGLDLEAESTVAKITRIKDKINDQYAIGGMGLKEQEVMSKDFAEIESMQATLEKIKNLAMLPLAEQIASKDIADLVAGVKSAIDKCELLAFVASLHDDVVDNDVKAIVTKIFVEAAPEQRLAMATQLTLCFKGLDNERKVECLKSIESLSTSERVATLNEAELILKNETFPNGSFEELNKSILRLNDLEDLPVSKIIDIAFLKKQTIEEYLRVNVKEMQEDPSIATRLHSILHNVAQSEVVKGRVESAFRIEAMAATIPVFKNHPLYEMDKAILEGSARQVDPKLGAYFSGLDSSIVKGGTIHATQRIIDGQLINGFDFKISHYARDELSEYLESIINNPIEFKAALPEGLCRDVAISHDVPHQFNRFDPDIGEYTRTGGYSPEDSTATVIDFIGAGKIIIGNNKSNGIMYNWIQVELEANLPSGEGVKKLQQILAVMGLGPVLGKQPQEADERMKIAQLFRAFYPLKATVSDTTKAFYNVPIATLKNMIIALETGMEAVFKKYLETSPHLMQKTEIMPGKEIWSVTDLGEQMKAKGAWGLMTGIGNSGGWDSAKLAVGRLLTVGAMSSEQRFQTGVFKYGASSSSDMMSGGGDQVFTRLVNSKVGGKAIGDFIFSGSAQVLWNLKSSVQRVPYGYNSDQYGVKNRFDHRYHRYESRESLIDLAESITNTSNEVMLKNSLDPTHIDGFVVESEDKKNDLIAFLVAEGLAEKDLSGVVFIKVKDKSVQAETFIRVGDVFEQNWWG